MKAKTESTLQVIFFIVAILIFVYLGVSLKTMLGDKLVIKCISEGDIYYNKYQRELCIEIMEEVNYHKRKDCRKDLYLAIKSFDKKTK